MADNIETEATALKKAKRCTGQNRWKWSDQMVDNLLQCLLKLKSQYEFKGIDFNSDLVKLYREVRVLMASLSDIKDFGPVTVMEIDDDLPPDEQAKAKSLIVEEKN